jgi:hypothetical protein
VEKEEERLKLWVHKTSLRAIEIVSSAAIVPIILDPA